MGTKQIRKQDEDIRELLIRNLDGNVPVPIEDIPPKVLEMLRKYYEDDQILNMSLTTKDIRELNRRRIRLSGASPHEMSIMRCNPEACPFNISCPLMITKMPPMGMICPIEEEQMMKWINKYTIAIGNRLEIEPEDLDIVLRNSIVELAVCDLYIRRAEAYIASDGIMCSTLEFVIQSGQTFYVDAPHAALNIIEKMNKRRSVIYKELLATPEMSARYKKKMTDDVANELGNLMHATLKTIKKEAEKLEAQTRTSPKVIEYKE